VDETSAPSRNELGIRGGSDHKHAKHVYLARRSPRLGQTDASSHLSKLASADATAARQVTKLQSVLKAGIAPLALSTISTTRLPWRASAGGDRMEFS
jgi:hypothetical protein